jgi:hypothetical protein
MNWKVYLEENSHDLIEVVFRRLPGGIQENHEEFKYILKGCGDAVLHLQLLGFGLIPSSGILGTREHDVSETGSVSVLRCGKGIHLLSWVP